MLAYISNSGHYGDMLGRVQSVKRSLWIELADGHGTIPVA